MQARAETLRETLWDNLFRIFQFRPLGIDLFCLGKKFLVFNIVSRNLKIKYRRSVLGIFWTLLSPIAMTLVYYFVFKVILNVQIPHYAVFVLSGVLPWNFFSQSVIEGMESIVGNWGLLSKVPIPPQVFPFAGILTNLISLAISIPVLIAAALVSRVDIGFSLLLILFYLPVLFILTYSIGLILGIGFVYFRDLRHLAGIVMQLWFYATPVLYDDSMIPPRFRFVLFLNPVATIFTGIHKVLAHGTWPSTTDIAVTTSWALAFLIVTLVVQKYFSKELVERI